METKIAVALQTAWFGGDAEGASAARGLVSSFPEKAKRLAEAVEAIMTERELATRERLASWMIRNSFATGHGDTVDDLLTELFGQITDWADKSHKPGFLNRLRSLWNIDGHLLPELTKEQQIEFVRDPIKYFIRTDRTQSDAIWREIEKRQA